MIGEATVHADNSELLDRLVPPPRPLYVRVLLWSIFLVVVVGGSWSVTSGTVVPRIGHSYVVHHGGSGPVVLGFTTTNRSRVDIEIVAGPRSRSGLQLRGYTVSGGPLEAPANVSMAVSDPFPIRLHPGEVVEVTAWFDVADCNALASTPTGDRQVDLQVRIADGPFSAFTATRQIGGDWPAPQPSDALVADSSVTDVSWPVLISRFACPGKA